MAMGSLYALLGEVSVQEPTVKGTNSEGKETVTQINDMEHKDKINIHPEKNEEIRIQKNEERLRNFWDNFKHSNI